MLNVPGAGASIPETLISNSLLKSLGNRSLVETLETQTGIKSRRSSLPEAYITGTGNYDPRQVNHLRDYRRLRDLVQSLPI